MCTMLRRGMCLAPARERHFVVTGGCGGCGGCKGYKVWCRDGSGQIAGWWALGAPKLIQKLHSPKSRCQVGVAASASVSDSVLVPEYS